MYISYGSTDPSIVRYFSKRVPRSLSTTSGQFVIDSATVAACNFTSPSSSRPAKVKFPAQAPGFGRTCVDDVASMASKSVSARARTKRATRARPAALSSAQPRQGAWSPSSFSFGREL